MQLDKKKVKRQMQKVGIKNFKELAEKVDRTPTMVSKWFHGGRPSMEVLMILCDLLECTPNDLIRLKDLHTVPIGRTVVHV